MNTNERAELAQALSTLLERIHRLPSGDLLAVMEVDDRVRRGMTDASDLVRLRAIVKGLRC